MPAGVGEIRMMNKPPVSGGGAAGLGLGLDIASSVGQIASSVISGLGQIAVNKINAQRTANVYDFNAKLSELQGRMTRLAANIEIKNIRKRAANLFSTQRTSYAKAGVKMEGSPAAVMVDSLKESELDALYTDISAEYNVGLSRMGAEMKRGYGQSALMDIKVQNASTILKTGRELTSTFNSYLKRA